VSKFGALVEEHKRRKGQGTQERGAEISSKGKGRPPGKRSNPEYEQVTSYLRRDTYQAVKVALLQSGGKAQFIDLVEELLDKWLSGRKGAKG
jgi:hypothetical protein